MTNTDQPVTREQLRHSLHEDWGWLPDGYNARHRKPYDETADMQGWALSQRGRHRHSLLTQMMGEPGRKL